MFYIFHLDTLFFNSALVLTGKKTPPQPPLKYTFIGVASPCVPGCPPHAEGKHTHTHARSNPAFTAVRLLTAIPLRARIRANTMDAAEGCNITQGAHLLTGGQLRGVTSTLSPSVYHILCARAGGRAQPHTHTAVRISQAKQPDCTQKKVWSKI